MNDNLTELQKDGIKKWDGKEVLSLYPVANGGYGLMKMSTKNNESYQSTEFWCAMEKLDDLKVPRVDESNGETYSVVGRIMWLSRNN